MRHEEAEEKIRRDNRHQETKKEQLNIGGKNRTTLELSETKILKGHKFQRRKSCKTKEIMRCEEAEKKIR